MPKEIEHKFLVNPKSLPRPLIAGKRIEQGYLCTSPAVRVRIVTEKKRSKAFLTIKSKGLRVRDEFEYEIPVADARQLMKLCGPLTLKKIRRVLGRWEVDEFLGSLRGLWMAECEMRSQKERLPSSPAWLGKEVTEDRRYTNSALATARAVPQ